MSDEAPPQGVQGEGASWGRLSRSDLLAMNRSLRLGGSIPPDLFPWLLKQLKNLADPEFLHPPKNLPANARTRVAAMKLLGGMLGLGVKQQQVDINLFRAAGLDEDDARSPANQDADALREALEFLRSQNPGSD